MNIYEALRQSHDQQRQLYQAILKIDQYGPERNNLYRELKIETSAHAAAEERHFLMPLLGMDSGINLSRHAIAEHHELDELFEKIDELEQNSVGWLPKFMKLAAQIEHHLVEEERGFFQYSGKLLNDQQKQEFGAAYLVEYERLKKLFAEQV